MQGLHSRSLLGSSSGLSFGLVTKQMHMTWVFILAITAQHLDLFVRAEHTATTLQFLKTVFCICCTQERQFSPCGFWDVHPSHIISTLPFMLKPQSANTMSPGSGWSRKPLPTPAFGDDRNSSWGVALFVSLPKDWMVSNKTSKHITIASTQVPNVSTNWCSVLTLPQTPCWASAPVETTMNAKHPLCPEI